MTPFIPEKADILPAEATAKVEIYQIFQRPGLPGKVGKELIA
jgi:hypothetical protein